MSLADLVPGLEALSRADKLQAIRILADALAEEERLLAHLQSGAAYEVSSPLEATAAAAVMQELLLSERADP
jgi:hypothetical protein